MTFCILNSICCNVWYLPGRARKNILHDRIACSILRSKCVISERDIEYILPDRTGRLMGYCERVWETNQGLHATDVLPYPSSRSVYACMFFRLHCIAIRAWPKECKINPVASNQGDGFRGMVVSAHNRAMNSNVLRCLSYLRVMRMLSLTVYRTIKRSNLRVWIPRVRYLTRPTGWRVSLPLYPHRKHRSMGDQRMKMRLVCVSETKMKDRTWVDRGVVGRVAEVSASCIAGLAEKWWSRNIINCLRGWTQGRPRADPVSTPCRPVTMWSYDHMVKWPCDHMIIWSNGHVIIWPHGHMIM